MILTRWRFCCLLAYCWSAQMLLRDAWGARLARRALLQLRLPARCLGSLVWINNLALCSPCHVPCPRGARRAAALGAFPTAVTAGAAQSTRALTGAAKPEESKEPPVVFPHTETPFRLSVSAAPSLV